MSKYALRMAKLSARIFVEPTKNLPLRSERIYKAFSEQPKYKNPDIVDYYPRHIEATQIFKQLRIHGLFRDHHLDFVEQNLARTRKKGKSKPKKGEGKRAKIAFGKK